MKRILAMILAALMLCCVFVACDEGDKPSGETTTAAKTEAPTTEEPTTEEPTTEEETTDDGIPDLVDVYIDVWEDKSQSPQALDSKHKGVGIRFVIPEGGYLFEGSVSAPSYSDDLGSLNIKLFAWDTDFETTVSKNPLQLDEFVDFADNSTLTCEYEEGKFGAGTYLLLVCDGVDEQGEGVGVWMDSPIKDEYLKEEVAKYEIASIINGKENKKKIGKFSLVIVEPEAE
ncbi:MAG: hypothetical protein IJW70_05000 [Clostridia bacterium]|nr:hypothetical protein [Clostridia bacterium]